MEVHQEKQEQLIDKWNNGVEMENNNINNNSNMNANINSEENH